MKSLKELFREHFIPAFTFHSNYKEHSKLYIETVKSLKSQKLNTTTSIENKSSFYNLF
jgi:hypothetical protein